VAAQGSPSDAVISETVRSHFAAAQEAQQRGDYAAAEREYRAILTEAPNFAEVHMNLGLLYQLQNRTPEAMAEFRSALKIKPTLAGANFFLGVNYCKNGDGASAIPYLKAASRQEPNRPDIWSWLATAQEISGDSQAEVTTLKHALSLQPRDIDMLYLLGHAYERLGKQEVGKLEQASPASSWSEQLLGESYSSSTEWSSAVIRFQNAIALSPNRPGLHVRLGEVFLHAARLEQAAQEFEQELEIDSNNLRAIVRRGEVKLIQGDIDAALKDWTWALNMDRPRTERVLGIHDTGFLEAPVEQLPDSLRQQIQALVPQLRARHNAAADLALAFVTVQNGGSLPDATEAGNKKAAPPATCVEREVRKALDTGQYSKVSACLLRVLAPNSSRDLRIQATQALFELGEYESALQALRGLRSQQYPPAFYWRARCFEKLATQAYLRLYQADPNSYRAHQLMGDLEAAKGNDGKAIEEYRAAIAMKPSVPNLHYSLGHLLWKELKTDEARKEFNAELELNPRNPGALHDLGNTYLLEHQAEKALAYLKRALEADPEDPDIHRDLGTAYADLRDYAKAEAEFRVAITGDHDGSVHYQLARVYQAQGEKESAAREFEISTSLNRESHAKLEKQTERINQIEAASSQHR
jgi:tetratricopeptide (TPR) repeat protein